MRIKLVVDNVDKKMFIPSVPDTEEGRWSYFNVYYLEDIKNIYNIFLSVGSVVNTTDLYILCKQEGVKAENSEPWSKRKLLEITNCLKKTGFVKDNKPIKGRIFESQCGQALTEKDRRVFKEIYLSYFRFKDFHRLFRSTEAIDNEGEEDRRTLCSVVYAFKEGNRFFNHFYVPERKQEYTISENNSEIMRFWDVYLKWGEMLDLTEKVSLKTLGIDNPLRCKDMTLAHFLQPMPSDFSVLSFCVKEYGPSYVYIPQLYWMIVQRYSFSIRDIKNRLIQECLEKRSPYRMQSTSKIFVNSQESNILPLVDNRYMSHLLKL